MSTQEQNTPTLTFLEFLGRRANSWEDPAGTEWQKQYLSHLFKALESGGVHSGDCTKQSYTCDICFLTSVLNDWDTYTFNRQKFMEENEFESKHP